MCRKLFVLALMATFFVFVSACGSDDDKSNNIVDVDMDDPDVDTDMGPTDPPDMTPMPTGCAQPLAMCNAETDSNDNFLCADTGLGERCYSRCTAPMQGQAEPCPSGQICLQASQGGPGYCQPSQCSGFLDSEGCSEIVANHPAQFPNGVNCVGGLRNNTFLCMAAGTAGAGEMCDITAAGGFFQTSCREGFLCEETCTELCRNSDDCEVTGESCIGAAAANVLQSGVGFCGEACTPFELGSCDDSDKGCFPLTADEGLCLEVGDIAPYEECGVMGSMRRCGEGLRCVRFTDDDARCLPFCNPTLNTTEARDASCMIAETTETTGYVRFFHAVDGLTDPVGINFAGGDLGTFDFGEFLPVAGFETVDAGDIATVISLDGTDIITEDVAVAFNDALLVAVLATGTLDTPTQELLILEEPRNNAAPEAGNAKIRLVHGVNGLANVDVVATAPEGDAATGTDLFLGLDSLAVSSFAEVAAGSYDLHVFAAGDRTEALHVFADVELADGLHATVFAIGYVENEVAEVGLAIAAYASAPRVSGLGNHCLSLGENVTVQSGACLAQCQAADYGLNLCPEEADGCSVISGLGGPVHACFPGKGEAGIGDTCVPGMNQCDELSTCLGNVCTSFCETGEATNPLFSCFEGQTCRSLDADLGFGVCDYGCSVSNAYNDFTDENCPEALGHCFPTVPSTEGVAGTSPGWCSATGDVALGATCASPENNTCSPGGLCVNQPSDGQFSSLLLDPIGDVMGQTPECRTVCSLFTDTAPCPSGQACAFDLRTGSTVVGYCLDAGAPAAPQAMCANPGQMCGNGGYCLTQQGQNFCLQMCSKTTGDGCPGNFRCDDLFEGQGPDDDFGYCVPQN